VNAPAPRAAETGERLAEVDLLKALGAVVIVLVHSIRPRWDPTISTAELWLGDLTRFAVPGFLAVSGYLAASREHIPLAITARRLRRVLVPYLVASVAAQIFWMIRGTGPQTWSLATDLLLGASFGIYYYVFVIAGLFLAAPLLPHLRRRVLVALLAVLLAAQWVSETDVLGVVPLLSEEPAALFWKARSPLMWWAYFLAGWLLGLERQRAESWLRSRRVPLVAVATAAALGCATGLALLAPGTPGRLTVAWVGIWAILALVWVAACGHPSPPEIRWLSDATYAVYLFHLFFVLPAQALVPSPVGRLDPFAVALSWGAGLAGALLLAAVARRLFPSRARVLVGA
jgi:surface polysaccharide O-acyltransferase-like enzyme